MIICYETGFSHYDRDRQITHDMPNCLIGYDKNHVKTLQVTELKIHSDDQHASVSTAYFSCYLQPG